jgi:PAS domain S-box-containing protein
MPDGDAERALDRVWRLQRLTAALSEAVTAHQVASVIVDQGIEALEARSGRLTLVSADGSALEVLAHSGYTRVRSTIPIDAPLPTNEVIRTGRPMFISTFDEVRARFPDLGDAVEPVIPGALASAPLIVDGRVIGAMTLVFDGDREFQQDDRDLLIALATQCAQALERARLYELSLMIQDDLRRSRDQLAAILGGIAEGVTVQDLDGRLIYANDVAARMSGFASAQDLQQAIPRIVQEFTLFDEAGNPFSFDDLPGRRLLRGEPADEVVLQFRDHETGDWRWSILDATPIRDEQGNLRLVVNIFRDMTERKRQTDSTAFLAAASTILVSTLDVADSLQKVADLAAPRIADWCAVDLLDDQNHFYRVAEGFEDGQDVSQLRSQIEVPLRARGQTLGRVMLGTTGSGRRLGQRDLELAEDLAMRAGLAIENARLYREANEQADHQAVLNAALRATVEERDQAVLELQEALRTRDEFLASASHDLKNPLASIKATAQLLERRLDRPEPLDVARLREGLQRVDAIATRAAGLVEELLDLTRLQMGSPLDLDRRPTDLVRLAREVAAELQQTTEQHQLRVESPESELVGLWDARRLGRVLSNLLDNAVKYSPDGGPIVVRVGRDGDWATVEVVDNGIGIPTVDHGRIFERFQRASNVQGSIGGTGIGLASARHILASHGGTIVLDSREGAGATFTLRLPIALEADAAESTFAGSFVASRDS